MLAKRLFLAAAFVVLPLVFAREAEAASRGESSQQGQAASAPCSPLQIITGIVSNTEPRSGSGFESHPAPGPTALDPIDVEIIFSDPSFAAAVVLATSEAPTSGSNLGFGPAIIKSRTPTSVLISAASNNPYQIDFAALLCHSHP